MTTTVEGPSCCVTIMILDSGVGGEVAGSAGEAAGAGGCDVAAG